MTARNTWRRRALSWLAAVPDPRGWHLAERPRATPSDGKEVAELTFGRLGFFALVDTSSPISLLRRFSQQPVEHLVPLIVDNAPSGGVVCRRPHSVAVLKGNLSFSPAACAAPASPQTHASGPAIGARSGVHFSRARHAERCRGRDREL